MSKLTSREVTEWVNKDKTWGPTTKRNAITAVVRGFSWACKNRGLKYNPITGMEKPQAESHSSTVTEEEFEKLLAAVPDQRFRDLLVVSFDSRAGPQEVKRLEARHVELELERAVLPTKEAKGKKKARVVYFPTPRSRASNFVTSPVEGRPQYHHQLAAAR